MDGEEDRDQQDGERQGEDPAVPEIVRFPQGGEANSDEQDDDQQAGDVESESPHGSTPGEVMRAWSVHGHEGTGPSIHRSQSRPWGMVFPAPCRPSRLLSLQIPTGIITRQPMVRMTIQTERMVKNQRIASDAQTSTLRWKTAITSMTAVIPRVSERCPSDEVPKAERAFVASGQRWELLSVSWLKT